MSPAIDYALLGKAVSFYRTAGYSYVEVPWAVEDDFVEATLDSPNRSYLDENRHTTVRDIPMVYKRRLSLVGSAEQGFLSMDLAPGRYVGCTPCFRVEPVHDMLYQPWFMKVELFGNDDFIGNDEPLRHALDFFRAHGGEQSVVLDTDIGQDVMLAGVEIGSYGHRTAGNNRPWCYGTGLALPRFSVARQLAGILSDG